jgi:protein-disulfide isomerase
MGALRKILPILAVSLALAACGGNKAADVAKIGAEEPSLGKADAPVTVVEYASLSCPHCARFNNDVMPAFKAKHIDTGEVHYALREVTTAPESFAVAAFLMAKCAGKDKYYPVVDAVYRGQEAILQSNNWGDGLRQIALSAGMSDEQFKACINDEKEQKALAARVKANFAAGVESTPTFFVNGKKVTGEQTIEQLDKLVAEAKAAKK